MYPLVRVRVRGLELVPRRHDDEVALRGRERQPDLERVRQGDGVIYVFEQAPGELRRLCLELLRGELAVEDVRRAERLEERRVVQRGGGDDGSEAGEASELDDWTRETTRVGQ